ncbi:hypothetical protein SAMN04487996_10792 [Dyadobacter soli]|uniref:Uncharacterized protein n=1 Tax=Dyadobacter soli TaxID=659014 RepID=A0A1G7G217_9BACT|nr:hypothetical protein SAMN04487996_10792 [Dyadobacter soli]
MRRVLSLCLHFSFCPYGEAEILRKVDYGPDKFGFPSCQKVYAATKLAGDKPACLNRSLMATGAAIVCYG